jgi:hypothetical protein
MTCKQRDAAADIERAPQVAAFVASDAGAVQVTIEQEIRLP